MNTEELKMVLDTIQQLGDQGTAAFVLYVVFDSLLTFIGVTVAVIVFYKLVVLAMGRSELDEFVINLRKQLGVGSPGPLVDSELRAIRHRITELLDREKESE